jgi:hypothetical protein
MRWGQLQQTSRSRAGGARSVGRARDGPGRSRSSRRSFQRGRSAPTAARRRRFVSSRSSCSMPSRGQRGTCRNSRGPDSSAVFSGTGRVRGTLKEALERPVDASARTSESGAGTHAGPQPESRGVAMRRAFARRCVHCRSFWVSMSNILQGRRRGELLNGALAPGEVSRIIHRHVCRRAHAGRPDSLPETLGEIS